MSLFLQRPVRQWALAYSRFNGSRSLSIRHGIISSQNPVDLSFTSIIPENGNETEKPLVILHGLFGSKRNWGSICKALHRDMPERAIYALDLRNHGLSPHATPMNYETMAADVHNFIQDKKLTGVALLGHSMGGKVAMAYALTMKELGVSSDILSQLIVVDIAPSIGTLSNEFKTYVSAMQEIESLPASAIKTRTDADKYLKTYEPELSVRQFLLTNLQLPSHLRTTSHHDHAHEKAKFIIPLGILGRAVDDLGSFPYEYNASEGKVSTTWDGPTLALKGRKSPYINHKNIPTFRAFFPNMQLNELDTGHWVHAENPTEFRKLVVKFLNEA